MTAQDKEKLISRAERFANFLHEPGFEKLTGVAAANNRLNPGSNPGRANIENIESGISGYLFFLFEVYKITGSERYLSLIRTICNDLVTYCKKNETTNYSLYTGRGGIVYFLLHLYRLTGEEYLLDEAIDLIKPSEKEFLDSSYTSDYLYNGRAGTLLLLTDIYKLRRSTEILELINHFTTKIIQNGILGTNGLSWKAPEEVNLKNSCGFAFGSSGILFALKNLDGLLPDPALEYLINNINAHIESCWDDHLQNWMNFEKDITDPKLLTGYLEKYAVADNSIFHPDNCNGWANGKVGIQIALGRHEEVAGNSLLSSTELNLFNGLSGIGLSMLSHPQSNMDALNNIISQISDQQTDISPEGGLLFGNLGINYFLLKTISAKNEADIIIYPGIETEADKAEAKLRLTLTDVRKMLLNRHFWRTIFFLENTASPTLRKYLSNPEIEYKETEIVKFARFISDQAKTKAGAPAVTLLTDVFNLENQKLEFAQSQNKSTLQISLDKFNHRKEILSLLNRPDDWIRGQKIGISKNVKIAISQWNWINRTDVNFTENLYELPASHEYIFFNSAEGDIMEYSLKVDGLVLHRFDSPKTINESLAEIKYYCQAQPKEALKEFSIATGSSGVDDFIDRLDFLVVYKVKQFLFEEVLEFVM